MYNLNLNRGYNEQLDQHPQSDKFKYPNCFSQSHSSKDPRLTRMSRMSVCDSTFNNHQMSPPIFNRFGSNPFPSSTRPINRRNSVYPGSLTF